MTMICRLRFLLMFFLVFLQIAHAENTLAENKTLIISDIHFSPFAGCSNNSRICPLIDKLNKANADQWPQILEQYSPKTLPENGQATNYTLIRSMLAQIKMQKPNKIIILGDFLAHRYRSQYLLYSHDLNRNDYEVFVTKTLKFLTNSIQAVVPANTVIYPVIGNNDTYGGQGCAHTDYCTIANGIFFHNISKLWSPLIKDNLEFSNTFSEGGYYQVKFGNSKNHLIVLNTVIFSAKAQGPNLDKAAQQQLAWLKSQLENIATQKEKTWIIFHIPPGIDTYASAKSFFSKVIPFWDPIYSQEFLKIINQYNSIINGVLSGHTHMNGSSILTTKEAATNQVTDIFVPSISPIFGNNPSYKIYMYNNKDFKPLPVSTYYLDLKKKVGALEDWQEA